MGGRGKRNSILVVQFLLKNWKCIFYDWVTCLIINCYMKYFVIVFLNYFIKGWRKDRQKLIGFIF